MKNRSSSDNNRQIHGFPLDLEPYRQQYNAVLKKVLMQRGLKKERFSHSWIALEGTPLRCEIEEHPNDNMHYYTLYYNDIKIALTTEKTSNDHKKETVYQILSIEPTINDILPTVLLEHDAYARKNHIAITPVFEQERQESTLPPAQFQQQEQATPNSQWQVIFPRRLTTIEKIFLSQIGYIHQDNAVDKFYASQESYRYCFSTRSLFFNGIQVVKYYPNLTVNSKNICDAVALNSTFTPQNGVDFLAYQYLSELYNTFKKVCCEPDLIKKSINYKELMALRIPRQEAVFDYYFNNLNATAYVNWKVGDIIRPNIASFSLSSIKSGSAPIPSEIITQLHALIDERISKIGNHWGVLYNKKLSNEKKAALEALKQNISAADTTTIDTLAAKISAWVNEYSIINTSRSRINFWRNEAFSTQKMLTDLQEALSPKK